LIAKICNNRNKTLEKELKIINTYFEMPDCFFICEQPINREYANMKVKILFITNNNKLKNLNKADGSLAVSYDLLYLIAITKEITKIRISEHINMFTA
jgi:hypothetical protein